MKKTVLAALAFLLLPACIFPAYASVEEDTIVMGCYPDPGMMNIDTVTFEKSGYAYEYMQEIAYHAGWRYKYVYGSFSEVVDKLEKGEIDIVPVVSASIEHREKLLFPSRRMANEIFYLASLQKLAVSDDFKELNGKRVGSVEGYFQNQVFENFQNKANIQCSLVQYKTSEEKWMALQEGKIDVTIESSLVLQPLDLHPVCEFGSRFPVYTAVSPNRPDILSRLNKAHEDVEKQKPGFLNNLRSKYFKAIPLFKDLPAADKKWIEEHKVLRIGAFYNDIPLIKKTADGGAEGVLPDYVDKMFESYGLNLPVEWKFYYTNDEALQALRNDEIDVIHPYYYSYSVAEKDSVIMSSITYKSAMSILYKGEFTSSTMERVATPVTRLGAYYVKDNYPASIIVPCQSGYDCVEKLRNDEADCVVMNSTGLAKIANEQPEDYHIKTINTLCNCSFAALPSNPEAIDIINHAVPFLSDTDLNAIEAYHFSQTSTGITFGQLYRTNLTFRSILILLGIFVLMIPMLLKRKKDLAMAKRAKERNKMLLDNLVSSYDLAYIVNLSDDSYKLLKAEENIDGTDGNYGNFFEAKEYFLGLLREEERERMKDELDYDTIRRKLSNVQSYVVEYHMPKNGVALLHEMNVADFGNGEVGIGFSEKNTEILKRHLEEKNFKEWFALFEIDVDSQKLRVIKNEEVYKVVPIGGTTDYVPYVLAMADSSDKEGAEFLRRISDVNYLKTEMLTEDRRYNSYTWTTDKGERWVDATLTVMHRHNDGTPEIVTLAFGYSDTRASERKKSQARLKESMQMIGGLAEEYHALYYFNIRENIFKVYSLDEDKFPGIASIVNAGSDPVETLRKFGMSPFVHPDDRSLFENLDSATIRERLSHRKKFTERFRRKFGNEFLWTELDVIKYEDVDEEPNAVVFGFAVRDEEIRNEMVLRSSFDILNKGLSPDESVNQLLSIVGDYYGAERAYIFEYGEKKKTVDNTYEWCAPGIEPMIEKLQGVPEDAVDGWFREFRRKGAFFMNSLDTEHNTPETVAILEMQGISSLIAAPLFSGNEITGFIGVDNPTKATSNIKSLSTIAAISYSEIMRRRENDEEHVTLSKLADTFISVYYADLSRDYLRNWKISDEYRAEFESVYSYKVSMLDFYVEKCIAERDRERCRKMTSPEYILEQFKTKDHYAVQMTDIMKGYERDLLFDYLKVSEDGSKFVMSCTDVTESFKKEREQQKQLSEALSMAQSASRAKTVFLNNMSHDIRTPMNAIIGYTNLASGHIDDKEQVRNYLDKISTSSNHLLSLINDVLDMSRIESGKVSLEEQPENLSSIVLALRDIVQTDVKAKNHELKIDISSIVDENVFCDRLRLNQALLNILSNSIKYTAPGGKILMSVAQTKKISEDTATYEFRIKDNGIGMSKEFIDEIFKPFTRAKSSTLSGIQGTGLGMTITKTIIDMMGGTIDVFSEPGKGSETVITVGFRLSEAVVPELEQIVPDFDLSGRKILLVEDNDLNREIATAILEEYGCSIFPAEDGSEALALMQKASAGDYDLVLMDIQMPVMDGYEATRRIRALGTEISRIPILAMTANAFEEDRREALAAGMNEHIAKPIEIDKLKETIAKFL